MVYNHSMYATRSLIKPSEIRFLLLLSVLFVFYGTLIPFEFRQSFTFGLSSIVWTPFLDSDGSFASIPDIVQNILLFMPVGFLAFLSSKPSNGIKPLVVISAITLSSFLLSLTVETLQLLSVERISSVTDLCTNSLGGLIGALVGWVFRVGFAQVIRIDIVRQNIGNTSFSVFVVSAFLAVLYFLQPFDFSLDLGSVWGKVKYFVRNPLNFSTDLKDEWITLFIAMLVAHSAKNWLSGFNKIPQTLAAFAIAFALLWMLEFAQFIVRSRLPSGQDLLVLASGAFIGALLPVRSNKWLPTGIILVLGTVGLMNFGLYPFEFDSQNHGFNWLPFHAYYQRTSFVALSNFIESMMNPLAFVFAWSLNRNGRVLLPFVSVLFVAVIVELSQQWSPSRYADVTDIIGALCGVFVGAWLAKRCLLLKNEKQNSEVVKERAG